MVNLRPLASLAISTLIVMQSQAADQTLTLEQALALALSDNTRVVNAELEAEATAEEVGALKAQRLPTLGVGGTYSSHLQEEDYTFEEGVWGDGSPVGDVSIRDVDDTSGHYFVDVVQPLSEQYALSLGIERGEVEFDAAEENVRNIKRDLASQVKHEYFGLLQMRSNLAVTGQSIAFYESLRDLVGNYVDQQIALEYELLDVEARLARLGQKALVQKNALLSGKQRLNRLLNRPIDTGFKPAALDSPSLYQGTEQDALETALARRPDLAGQQMKVRSAELGYDLKKAEYIPTVDLTLRYSKRENHDFIPDEEGYVGLRANWELVDWGRRRRELASEQAQVSIARNQVASVEEKIRIDVSRAFQAADESTGAVEVANLSRAAAREKLRVLMNEYRQQSALLKDVLDAQTELARAENDYERAQLDVWQAQSELQRAMGDF